MPSLTKPQENIWNDTSRYRVVVCGRRFGKTTLAVWEMKAFAFMKPNTKVVYVAPTIKQARDIAWAMLKEITRDVEAAPPNETRLELKIYTKNGQTSEIWLRGSENVDSLRGQRIDFLVVDEVASIRNWYETWDEVLRATLMDTQGQAMFIGTPKGYNHFYDLYTQCSFMKDFSAHHYTSYDNPHIPKEEIDTAKKELDEVTFDQEYLAKFTKFVGAVYREWDMEKQYREITYDAKLPLHLTFDFGVNDPTAIAWIQPMGGEHRVIDYYESSNANVDHFVQVIRSKPYKTPAMCTGDPSGDARSIVTGTSPIEEYRKHDINIRTRAGITIPEQIRIMHKYVPSLYVADTLPRVRDILINYRYPEKGTNLVNQSNEVPVHDEYSHGARALEYYFTNVDTGISQSFEDISRQFPEQKLFDRYGLPNV